MGIIAGRKHGNGYHDSAYQKIIVKPSQKFYDLLDYELEQIEKHGDTIYERDFHPSWIKRTCLNCFMTYMELKEGI